MPCTGSWQKAATSGDGYVSSRNQMKCKLCNEIKELKNSHIISETFYSGLYDKKHRALPIHSEYNDLSFIQKGIYEKLLCADCEMKISKWEVVLKRDLVDIGNLHSKFLKISKHKNNILQVENIRYKEFKLAVLSILWRMSISSHEFFRSYSLGPYEEKLRKTLHNELLPTERQYPILVSRYELDGVFYSELILGFPPSKYENILTVQQLIIWGHCFTIFVHDRIFPNLPVDIFLRESGNLYIGTRRFENLASKESVLARLFDKDVETMFEKKIEWTK